MNKTSIFFNVNKTVDSLKDKTVDFPEKEVNKLVYFLKNKSLCVVCH